MKSKNKMIYALISLIALLVPIGYLLGILKQQVAFPIMFALLGFQQLFYGFFIVSRENKLIKTISILLGCFLLLFSAFVIFPTYYL